jgi:hypothetical protein
MQCNCMLGVDWRGLVGPPAQKSPTKEIPNRHALSPTGFLNICLARCSRSLRRCRTCSKLFAAAVLISETRVFAEDSVHKRPEPKTPPQDLRPQPVVAAPTVGPEVPVGSQDVSESLERPQNGRECRADGLDLLHGRGLPHRGGRELEFRHRDFQLRCGTSRSVNPPPRLHLASAAAFSGCF